jgi:aspartate racemase
MGPQATAAFYLRVVERCEQRQCHIRPSILTASIALPLDVEKTFLLTGQGRQFYLDSIGKAVLQLERAGVTVAAIPCNTVTLLIETLREASSMELLDIVEITVAATRHLSPSRVAVLGASYLMSSGLYEEKLRDQHIDVARLPRDTQIGVDSMIQHVLDNRVDQADSDMLEQYIAKLAQDGADTVVLACTELHMLSKVSSGLARMVDSLLCLADVAVDAILDGPPPKQLGTRHE